MTGVPGVRLRGVQLALDAIDKTETALRSEAIKLAALLGDDAPIVQRARGHAVYLRNTFDLVTKDTASADRSPEGEDREDGLHAKHESAVAKPDAQPPFGDS